MKFPRNQIIEFLRIRRMREREARQLRVDGSRQRGRDTIDCSISHLARLHLSHHKGELEVELILVRQAQ